MNEFNSKYFKTALRMDEALIALLEKKDLEYITVKEICEEADVNRSTFYLHYETVGDLVDETTEMINKRFLSYFPQNERDISDALNGLRLGDLILVTGEYLIPYLRFMRDNKKIYRAAFRNPNDMQAHARYGEIHIAVQRFLYLSPTGELAPSVAGDRLYRFFRELGKRVYDRFRHRFSFPVRDLHRDIVSRLSLRERGKTCLAFPLSRHHRVRFPMPEFFAVIYAFIPFAYAFPRRESSAVPQPLPRFSFPA